MRGREKPDEIVVVGGHLDSWDVGTGAHDDGGGCVVSWEALRLMKKLGLRPRRTMRVVLFTNEENGLRGGAAYRDAHRDRAGEPRAHVRVRQRRLQADRASASPARDAARATSRRSRRCCAASAPTRIGPAAGAPTSDRACEAASVPALSLDVDGDYFLIHHTPADTVDKIDPRDMSTAVAAIAVMAYVVADMPERLK